MIYGKSIHQFWPYCRSRRWFSWKPLFFYIWDTSFRFSLVSNEPHLFKVSIKKLHSQNNGKKERKKKDRPICYLSFKLKSDSFKIYPVLGLKSITSLLGSLLCFKIWNIQVKLWNYVELAFQAFHIFNICFFKSKF